MKDTSHFLYKFEVYFHLELEKVSVGSCNSDQKSEVMMWLPELEIIISRNV